MPSHEHPRSRRHPVRPLTAAEAAAIRALGLQWRDDWRAEIAAGADAANGHAIGTPAPRPHKPTKDGAAQFAAAVARDAFGRFYWNQTQQEALANSLRNGRTKRPGRGSEPR
jgi:hypothetical protein